jgi:Spy/CpxP family protein refolding chaperone
MTVKSLLLAALIASPLITAPAFAQPASPAPQGMERGMAMGDRMFPSMSEAGRATMREAMAAGGNRREERQKVEAVRDRMLTLVAADKLDVAALRRVMDEERALGEASRQQRQTAMLAAVQKLSPEDRKAFAADSRAMKARMDARMDGWRDRWRQRRGGGEARPLPAPAAQPMEG